MKGQTRHFQKSFLAEFISELGVPLDDVEVTNNPTDPGLVSYLHRKEFNIKEKRFEQDEINPFSNTPVPLQPPNSHEIAEYHIYN